MSYRQFDADHPIFATVGGRIRAVRMAKGLAGEVVAKKLNIVRPTLVHWETGRTVTIPADGIEAFAKLTGVSAAWLKAREGNPPKLDFSKVTTSRNNVASRNGNASTASSAPDALPAPTVTALDPSIDAVTSNASVIAEIKPRLSAHARELDTTPQASWSIPREVMTLGFNCDPVHGFIHRVTMDEPPMADGTPINRGDYILIDPTRDVINEAGVYYVADPNGVEAQRIVVTIEDGKTVAKSHRTGEPVEIANLRVLGRTMAVFHGL